MMHWSQALSSGLALCFVSSLWQGTALALLVGLGLKAMPRTNASTRFAIWMTAFAILALLPFGALVPQAAAARSAITQPEGAAQHLHLDLNVRWAWSLGLLWLVGSLYQGISLALNVFRLRILSNASTLVTLPELDPQVEAALFVRGRQVQLRLSDRVNAPCAIGFLRPAVILPRWLWSRLTADELRQIVVHETGHLRRHDAWTNLLQKLALVVYPLNPALYWIERRLCLEREIACDDAVLATTASPAAYAACLAGLAEKKLLRRTAALAPGAWSRQPELLRRVQGILSRNRNASTRVAGILAAGFVAAVAGCAFFLAQAPQLVSFVAPQPAQFVAAAGLPGDLASYPAVGPDRAAVHEAAFRTPIIAAAPVRAHEPSHHAPRRLVAHPAVIKPISGTEVAAERSPEIAARPASQIAPVQPSVYQEVGILQSATTGRTWVVLSVWRPAPAQQPSSSAAASPAATTPSTAPPSAASAIQTGWLLIRI